MDQKGKTKACLRKSSSLPSTGKSTLCEQLAEHLRQPGALSLPVNSCIAMKRLCYDDLLTIAKGQLALEDEFTARLEQQSEPLLEAGGHIPLFIDTDMYVMKVWCEFVFNHCHRYILEQISERNYDLYLLCNIDLPWVKDDCVSILTCIP
jgi:nicotinamide riboside kinase